MASYQTPGVYVEEIPVLPTSVAQVATAIPAFIGHTQLAKKDGESVLMVPTRIDSLPDFREIFGGPPPQDEFRTFLDAELNVTKVEITPKYFLFDSLQLFFQNGGGACFIVSVGSYTEDVVLKNFRDGLKKLEKIDEPTLILYPDAALLPADELSTLQADTLAQCGNLQDRFGVFDLVETPTGDDPRWEEGKNAFRDGIGVNNLKYGAAYTPWLKVRFEKVVTFETLKLFNEEDQELEDEELEDRKLKVKDLSSDAAITDAIQAIETAIIDRGKIDAGVVAVTVSDHLSLREHFNKLVQAANQQSTETKLRAVFQYLNDVAWQVDQWLQSGDTDIKLGSDDHNRLNVEVVNLITNSLSGSMQKLIAYHKGGQGIGADGAADSEILTVNLADDFFQPFEESDSPWEIMVAGITEDSTIYRKADETFGTKREMVRAALVGLAALATKFFAAWNDIKLASESLVTQTETSLKEKFPTYKNIIAAVEKKPTRIPPSGAIVGVYAAVDRTRGVWKAPANVSLAGIYGLSEQITHDDQMALNVDVVAGKSINAIRFFTGKGNLIWGARTLAGNDNEWRYVPVRRFFNMVEESIEKATGWVVFEPNDANTWVRVKGMIDNYLTGLWRSGALAGEKPADAFFVSIGLNKTMTAVDILEGRLIIEVGLAAVRPAEFIILKFMHKLQEAA